MSKFIINKEEFGSANKAYNTWTIVIYDNPRDNSHGLYIFLTSLDAEFLIDESVVCPPEWYYVTYNNIKGYLKKNYQLTLIE